MSVVGIVYNLILTAKTIYYLVFDSASTIQLVDGLLIVASELIDPVLFILVLLALQLRQPLLFLPYLIETVRPEKQP